MAKKKAKSKTKKQIPAWTCTTHTFDIEETQKEKEAFRKKCCAAIKKREKQLDTIIELLKRKIT